LLANILEHSLNRRIHRKVPNGSSSLCPILISRRACHDERPCGVLHRIHYSVCDVCYRFVDDRPSLISWLLPADLCINEGLPNKGVAVHIGLHAQSLHEFSSGTHFRRQRAFCSISAEEKEQCESQQKPFCVSKNVRNP